MTASPTPPGTATSVREAVEGLAVRHGERRVVDVCCALIEGAPPETCADVAAGLSVHGRSVDQLRSSGYRDYWWPTWGARGLLHVWSPSAAAPVVHGIGNEHWRPAEMCLKVAACREVGEAAGPAVELAGHDLPRVRAAVLRTLGLVGDTEHVPTVRDGLDDDDAQVRRTAGLALERMVARLDLPGEVLP